MQKNLHVDIIPFLNATSETLGARASQVLPERFKELLLRFLQEAMIFYQQNNFNIDLIDTYIEFDSIKNSIGITMSIVEADSHVHLAEISTLITKERVFFLLQCLPF